jgi:hypothetical protein
MSHSKLTCWVESNPANYKLEKKLTDRAYLILDREVMNIVNSSISVTFTSLFLKNLEVPGRFLILSHYLISVPLSATFQTIYSVGPQ